MPSHPHFRATVRVARALPLIVFLLVIATGTWLEFAGGNVPGLGRDRPVTFPAFADGRLAAEIGAEFERASRVGALLRPRQAEANYVLFGEVTPAVTPGRDGWLFETSNVVAYPPGDGDAVVARHADGIAALASWFAERGARLMVLPVPNKWAVFPEKLPEGARPRAMWRPFQRALRERGVDVLDAGPVLTRSTPAAFVGNETHWTEEACLGTARLVADELRGRLEHDLPGAAVHGEAIVDAPRPIRGDLQRQLGFAPGSQVDRSFDVLRRPVRTRLQPVAPDEPTAEFVLCGTSFSRSFRFAAMLEIALARRVEDRSVAAQGPLVMLRSLIDDVRAGARRVPAFVIWEIPEKHLFARNREFLIPMEALVAELESESRFPASSRAALPRASVALDGLRAEGDVNGELVGTPESGDPMLILTLDEPLPGDEGLAICYRVAPRHATTTKILFDWGKGFTRTGSTTVALAAGSQGQLVVIPIAGEAGSTVRRLRLDPVDGTSPFVLGDLHLRRAR